jgi:putative NADH-flavin reductase
MHADGEKLTDQSSSTEGTPMKVLIFGASGAIGSAIAAELHDRGHEVVAASRRGGQAGDLDITTVTADATDADSVAAAAAGVDAIVSAIGPQWDGVDRPELLVAGAQGLVAGAAKAGVDRVIVVGGAGSLEVAPGVRVVDTPEFPAEWKPVAIAHADALEFFRDVDHLDWTYVSPPALIEAGERTGAYRTGSDALLFDDAGNSRITHPDFAIAIADELEQGNALKQRITVAH